MFNKQKFEDVLNIVMTAIIVNIIIFFFRFTGFENVIISAPFIVVLYKYGIKEYILSLVITVIPAYFIIGLDGLIVQTAMILAISVASAYCMKKRMPIGKMVIINAIASFVIILLSLLAFYITTKQNPFVLMNDAIIVAIDRIESVISNDINFTPEMIKEYIVYFKQMVNDLFRILPAIFLIYSLFISFTNLIIAIFIMKKTGIKLLYNTKINRLTLNKNFRYVFFVFIVFYIISMIPGSGLEIIAENLWAVANALLFFNGLSYIDYFLEVKVGKTVRVILWIIILVVFRLYSFIIFFGFMDLFTNMRYNIRKGKVNNG